MKILITGVSGFIGFNLTKYLLTNYNSFFVFGVDCINDYYNPSLKINRLSNLGINFAKNGKVFSSNLFSNFYFEKFDLFKDDFANSHFKNYDFDIVIHLAAQAGVRYSIEAPQKYIDNNILGFFNIIRFAQENNIPNFMYASSSSVYGDSNFSPFDEEMKISRPASLYAATKIANEAIAASYSNIHKINTIGLRFFTVYGPWGRPDMAYFKFTESILSGKSIDLYNNGELYRDFTFIDDVCKSITLLVNYILEIDNRSGEYICEVVNIGNSNPVKVIDFVNILSHVIGKEVIINNLEMQLGDVHRTEANVKKLFEMIGFVPNTDISYGLNEFYNWYKNYYN